MNRLACEKSPYLIQHADNPVDWFPWGDDPFEKARQEDRVILVSIGYSTCHWCHVMAHESFEDAAVAEEMNRHLVCIKVDREERPDIDLEYMQVCQRLTGRGGWPLNVFLTPQGHPFFAATYIPKQGHGDRMGMLELVPRLASLWRDNQDLILQSAHSIADSRTLVPPPSSAAGADKAAPEKAGLHFQRNFDDEYGGFYGAPKFPMAQNLRFLMRYAVLEGKADLVPMVEMTLEKMRSGGIWDHAGSGFHRYSVDRGWRLPHFEKMLYDQAMLAMAYLEGGLLTGRALFSSTAREILLYAMKDLQAPGGAFFSAEDADSEGGEGAFYTWDWRELEEILTPAELDLAMGTWGLRREGNFPPGMDQAGGRNLLARVGNEPERDSLVLLPLRRKLLEARARRSRPARDEKVLTDWNGLMIAALARSGACLQEFSFVEAAAGAASFVLEGCSRRGSGLWHRWAKGEWAIPGFLDDHAFLIWGLIELYQATLDPAWLRRALLLAEDALVRFAYEGSEALAFSEGTDPRLPVHPPVGEDGPYPCGNGVMAHNLIILGVLTGNDDLIRRGEGVVHAFSSLLEQVPWAASSLLEARLFQDSPPVRVWLGGVNSRGEHPFLSLLRGRFSPARVLAGVPRGMEDQATGLLEPVPPIGAILPWAQVCGRGTCFPPVFDGEVLTEQLKSMGGGLE